MIKIYAFHYNRPEYLYWQKTTFDKFLKEEHQLICVNNANDEEKKQAIQNECASLGIEHLLPSNVNHRQAGWSHQSAMQWAWDVHIKNDTVPVLLLDHDIFAIQPIEFPRQYDMVGVMQARGEGIKYFHPGILFINNTITDRHTLNFAGEKIDGYDCDSGGNLHYYLKAHPDLKIKGLSMPNICEEHENTHILPEEARIGYNEDTDFMQICEIGILHCRNGSNWAANPLHDRKKERLVQTLKYYLEKSA